MEILPPIFSFLIVLTLVLVFSKYELYLTLMIGAISFGILAGIDVFDSLITTLLDPAIILLAIAVLFIPILGGLMDESGLMVELVDKMDVSKKVSLMISPALYGLLPVAGGALMSAPIVDSIAPDMNASRKVAINVWYRHIFILIYPLSLLAISEIANINLYLIVIAMLIPFILLIIIGYVFFIRSIEEERAARERDIKKVITNLVPILIAPLFDIISRIFFNIAYPEIFLIIGLYTSVFVCVKMGALPIKAIATISKKMKIWRFPLLIVAMFLFLEIFTRSSVPDTIGNLKLPFILLLCIAFFLGFATGRIQLPLSIMIPIYTIQNSILVIPLLDFSFLYLAIFLGYLITPIHPCLVYSLNYFNDTYKNLLKHMLLPTFVSLGVLLGIYAFISLL
ncbi:MAG: conserved membrane protein of unknown function [Promethearchaeota archaeon]|nr:MAG: conserved membrane protein of unknown function [Candidatus Lokiarchaeota archaeon]